MLLSADGRHCVPQAARRGISRKLGLPVNAWPGPLTLWDVACGEARQHVQGARTCAESSTARIDEENDVERSRMSIRMLRSTGMSWRGATSERISHFGRLPVARCRRRDMCRALVRYGIGLCQCMHPYPHGYAIGFGMAMDAVLPGLAPCGLLHDLFAAGQMDGREHVSGREDGPNRLWT